MNTRPGFVAIAVVAGMLSPTTHASVLTPGENPGQYAISVYIDNDSDLPYPAEGLVGSGLLRYESDWLDQQLQAWSAWVDCEESLGECEDLYYAIHADTFDLDDISFDMSELLIDAHFEMYGVRFELADVVSWRETFDGSWPEFRSIATLLDLRQPGGNELYFGAGDEDYNVIVRLDGHSAGNDGGYCYAQAPDGAFTEDLCYDVSVDPVPAAVPEPGTLAFCGIGLAALGLGRRPPRRWRRP
jgi:hypothetical protein